MCTLPPLNLINNCREPHPWDLTNKFLYELCEQNFDHDTDEKVLAKTLIIGRCYAVALERRRNRLITEINDNFYVDKVAPCLRNSELDNIISQVKLSGELMDTNLHIPLKAHGFLTDKIFEITALNKRSFSLKYLHFHLPSQFYIYDSRAVKALKLYIKKVPMYLRYLTEIEGVDKEYTKFFCKCFHLKKFIGQECRVNLTTRELDKLLIEVANNNAIEAVIINQEE